MPDDDDASEPEDGAADAGTDATDTGTHTEERYERPIDRFRRGTAGSVVAAGLLGLRDAMEGRPEREETVIVTEAPSQPHDGSFEMVLDPDHPERSVVIVRRPPTDTWPSDGLATDETEH